jgi:hypothetical protein
MHAWLLAKPMLEIEHIPVWTLAPFGVALIIGLILVVRWVLGGGGRG